MGLTNFLESVGVLRNDNPTNPVVPETKPQSVSLPGQSLPVQGITPPTINGVPDDKFVKMLESVVEQNNIPGLDYFEFREAVENMKSLPLDEPTKYTTVYSIYKSQGCTKEVLLSSIDTYVGLIKKEQDDFNTEMAQSFKEKVEDKKTKIEESQAKIIELSNKIKELNDFIMTTTQETQQEEMKLRMADANFKQSVEKVVSGMLSDKDKITNYIK